MSNRTGAELGLTEKEGSFISNVGKLHKVYSDKDGDSGYYMAITIKELSYAKDWFVFHFASFYDTYEGLRHFNIEDTLFSIRDKGRNVSLKVGDGLSELQKFYPNYSLTCNTYGNLYIGFIENGQKRDGPVDDGIAIIVDKKLKKVTRIMTMYPDGD